MCHTLSRVMRPTSGFSKINFYYKKSITIGKINYLCGKYFLKKAAHCE